MSDQNEMIPFEYDIYQALVIQDLNEREKRAMKAKEARHRGK